MKKKKIIFLCSLGFVLCMITAPIYLKIILLILGEHFENFWTASLKIGLGAWILLMPTLFIFLHFKKRKDKKEKEDTK